jgi:predicted permease
MLRNYLIITIRNLKRNFTYTLVNTLGLSVGLAACLLLFMVVIYQTSFDDFHVKKDRIYRVCTVFHNQAGESYSEGAALPVADGLRADFPQIKQIARIFKWGGQVTLQGEADAKKMDEKEFYFAEPSFFGLFDFRFLKGDAAACLKNPNSAVLTKKTAEKYFGDWRSAIGKTFLFNNKIAFKITGILQDMPSNTDFPLSVVVPFSALEQTDIKSNLKDWVSTFSDAYTFVLLPEDFPVAKFNAAMPAFAKKYKPAEYAKDGNMAQPLGEMHFDSRFGNFNYHTFSHTLVKVLSAIGLFLILIACVNFINLSTAQAINRAKEVGVRKVLGGRRSQLAYQFLAETAVVVLIAFLIALGIAYLALPFLNNLLETSMNMQELLSPRILVLTATAIMAVTLLSGLYPALILAGFNPVTALKNKISTRTTGAIQVRRSLVVLQFVISQVLIICMLIVVSQMNYFRNAPMGFNKASMLIVPLPEDSIGRSRMDYLRNALQSVPDIKAVSYSYESPSADGNWDSDFNFDHASKTTDFGANLKWADPAYFSVYGLRFVAGHVYSPSDTVREFVVNETLLKKLGVNRPEDAIGKQISFWKGKKQGQIVGVVRDFNAVSLRHPMAPVVLSTWKDIYHTINIRIRPGAEKAVLPVVEQLWTRAFPNYVYSFKFLDDRIAEYYKYEEQLSKLYKIFAGIAIFISCIGLYGLVAFMALQRTRELGIRKVLGATALQIVYLLSREFTLLILVAFLLSAPLAYYFMSHWLQDFSYRISLGLPVFILALLASVMIAWLTAGYRAIQASLANPVRSLRTE